jgi:hypothetical protein
MKKDVKRIRQIVKKMNYKSIRQMMKAGGVE